MKVWSAREAVGLAVERKVVKSSKESRSSSFFTSEKSAEGERSRRSKRVGKESKSLYAEAHNVERTNAGCRESVVALNFFKRVGNSSDVDSPGGSGACVSYSSRNVRTAVIEMTSPTTSQEDVTAEWNEYARTWFSKCVVLHRKGGNEAENSLLWGP